MSRPLVFRIRRFSLDDGPGIRTVAFFKGCPLECAWCHNPEGKAPEAQLLIQDSRCIQCGECERVCPREASQPCSVCGRCFEACPPGARSLCGVHHPVQELVQILLKDRMFFGSSNGGVTFSGGEPTLHMEYVADVAKCLQESGVHVALETCGHFSWEAFRTRLLPFVDLVLYDLKLLNSAEHLQYTGVGNEIILENLLRLRREKGLRITMRTPLIPGITDTPANLSNLRHFLHQAGLNDHRLLPFNPYLPAFQIQGAEPCRSTSTMP
jgi:pyruvate formate lyase activating enzyme